MQRNLAAAYEAETPLPLPANDAPLPLKRAMRDAEPYPLDALGVLMGKAVGAAADMIAAPISLCAQSALANSALAVQGHVNTEKPWGTGKPGPISLFLLSVAESGDRKTTADEALGGDAIAEHEQRLEQSGHRARMEYENEKEAFDIAKSAAKNRAAKEGSVKAIADAMNALGSAPEAPLTATLTFGDPTIEGLHKHYATGQPSAGLFSSEGGSFVGGHGMSAENALKTAAQFSELWDGAAIKRLRAGDGQVTLRHRRLCFHIMLQPGAAHGWLSNPTLRDQGLFSRLLIAAPKSLAGTRLHRQCDPQSPADLRAFNRHLSDLLDQPLPISPDTRGELAPRVLAMDSKAKDLVLGFYDTIERQMGDGGHLHSIKGLAAKVTDHAVRLASVVGLFENMALASIGTELMGRGISLAQWYLDEALRLSEAEAFPPDLLNAERAMEWLREKRGNNPFSLPCLYMFGPRPLRTKETAKRAVNILLDHRQIIEAGGAHRIQQPDGTSITRRECFKLNGEG